jgi:putative ABC transport system ATP-binding protein
MNQQPIIQTTNLRKIYGMGDIAVAALDGVSVRIDAGEFVSIMGPSGSGKSTLMNILGCLDRPTEGHYILDGEDVSDLNKEQLAAIRNRQLGFIFQSYNLLSRTSALKNVMLPLLYDQNNHRSNEEREEMARAALVSVGLADRVDHQPNELSGGQKQRVAIARALINDPALLLADEPTGNLDTKSSHEIMDLLHELHDRGNTIVMVTHEPDIAKHTQRVICVRDGKVESDGRDGENSCMQPGSGD